MPIPDPQTFRNNTAPLKKEIGRIKIGKGYRSNLSRVSAALEVYAAQAHAAPEIRVRLLYFLWKECERWLRLKADKVSRGELFVRRKWHIEDLRQQVLIELLETDRNLARVLVNFQANKQLGARGTRSRSRPGTDRNVSTTSSTANCPASQFPPVM